MRSARFLLLPLSLALLLPLACTPSSTAPKGAASGEILHTEQPAPDRLLLVARGAADAAPGDVVLRAIKPLLTVEDGKDALPPGSPLPEGASLRISPAVEGRAALADAWSLQFTPNAGFRPDTTYTVQLEALPGTSLPPEALAESFTFKTPALTFLGASLQSAAKGKPDVELALRFSGAVEAESVARHLSVVLVGAGGERALTPSLVEGGAGGRVRVRVSDPAFAKGERQDVRVVVSDGVASRVEPSLTAPGGAAEVAVDASRKGVTVRSALVREGSNGFYIDVLCDDDSVEEKSWFWDRSTWTDYQISTRCSFPEAALAKALHVGGDVKPTIVPGYGGFRVFGNFTAGDIDLRLDGGLTSEDGGFLAEGFQTTLKIPHRAAQVRFAAQGRYLPRAAWKQLAIRHTNTDKVRLTVRHVPAENLVFWMTGSESADERTSNVVLSRELALSAPLDTQQTTWIDVGSLLPDAGQGVYELQIEQVETPSAKALRKDGDYWEPARAASRLLLTDMQVLAKVSRIEPATAPKPSDKAQGEATPTGDERAKTVVKGWVLDTHTNAPRSGVELKLVKKSGKVLGRCTSGSDGSCSVEVDEDPLDPAPPFALLASAGKDMTYIRFEDLQIERGADTEGAAWGGASAAYRAALYADRGVYRPGDVAHVTAILRTPAHVAPSAGLPVVLKVIDARGKEVRKKVLPTNEAGMVSVDVSFSDSAVTGGWSVTASVGDTQVGEARVQVEEFVPERLAVKAQASAAAVTASQAVPVEIEARWLFGGDASGARVEVGCDVTPSTDAPGDDAAWEGWSFGPAALDGEPEARTVSLGRVDGFLDAKGKGSVACPSNARALPGPATLRAAVAVFEGDSGRTTTATATTTVYPSDTLVGLKTRAKTLRTGDAVSVEGAVVDVAGKRVTGAQSVEVEIVRLEEEYGWSWDEDSGSTYRRMLRRVRESVQTVEAKDGSFTVPFTPAEDGAGYLVVARLNGGRTELYLESESRRWYWWSLNEEVDQTPHPQAPAPLVLDVQKEAKAGETVKVQTIAPYKGRVLFTVESDHVLSTVWKDVEAGPVEWSFPISKDTGANFQPTVYVSALLLKDPHLESQATYLPDRAFGVRPVRVIPEAFTAKLEISAPKEARPNGELVVDLAMEPTKEPTYVTVAAVDEGILSLTKFTSPDPLSQLFARRRLGVDTYETIGWTLLSQPGGTASHTGGDAEGAGGSGRVQMVKPVALWSGTVEVPPSGKAQVRFAVPGYRGQLRVMAVAASAKKVAHAEASVTVREPLVLQTTLPRFLVSGDRAELPVQVTNLTGKDQSVEVKVEIEGLSGRGGPVPVVMAGQPTAGLSLKKDESRSAVFQIRATDAIGAARVRVVVTGGGERSEEVLELPVQPAGPEVTLSRTFPLDGALVDLAPAMAGWVPGSDRTSVWVTANPYASSFGHLRYLLRYPYGCIEQTTSSTRPLLYASLLSGVDPELLAKTDVADMVQHGLDRILSMQTPSGGFSYWPGEAEPNPWGTVYATHLLLDAQAAGYAVPAESLDDAVSYLTGLASGTKAIADDPYHADYSKGALPYMHYLLARAGKPQTARARQLLEEIERDQKRGDLRKEDVYLLQAALQLSGDRRYEAQLRKPPIDSISMRRSNDWSFWSDLREAGFILSVYRDLFKDDAGGKPLADQVASALTRSRNPWDYTTQELAWALTGLARTVQAGGAANPAGAASAAVRAGGQKLEPLAGASEPTWQLFAASQGALQVEGGGKGLYAVVTTTGARVGADIPLGGQGLKLERRFLADNGTPIAAGALPLGKPIYVELTVENTTTYNLENIALVDRLPAGWEMENPRLGRSESPPEWVNTDAQWSSEHMNLRDDRVEVFGELGAREKRTVTYLVRAVTAGDFTAPGTSAEAMYDPNTWARLAPQAVKVIGPWSEVL